MYYYFTHTSTIGKACVMKQGGKNPISGSNERVKGVNKSKNKPWGEQGQDTGLDTGWDAGCTGPYLQTLGDPAASSPTA